MFDIYWYRGFTSLPNLEDFYKICPVVNIDEFQRLIMKSNIPCYLGLNMNLDIAKRALRVLIHLEHNAHGLIWHIKYRDEKPKLTVETAYPIAEKVIIEMQKEYPSITFSPIVHAPAYSMLGNLTFMSTGKEWVNEGQALFASVDILDGHIWTDDERDELNL